MDYIVRATAANQFVRAFACTTKGVTEHARKIHGLSPVCSAALGRTMAAGLMMGVMLKGEKDLLTIQFKGDGPIGGIPSRDMWRIPRWCCRRMNSDILM